ncbi:Enolase-phosphatase E1 [Ceratocystis fimbriata CBS 114723]|uniref:Enolase-phosphatase E1 n=1 Tax=Ceratocystis fimbriata CBS 114723 TaxID=1035309 RepID=A0A2C5W0P0_9PEZI|nr:Enolase-phosphatase E1 [Ceratocystis fimbriata CBS 114723]
MSTAVVSPIKVVLLDIEGTVCPISFVKDVLFPYALNALTKDLDSLWDTEAFQPYKIAFPPEYQQSKEAFSAHAADLIARDVKISYLKSLQGHLWKEGYQKGEFAAPLFPDVADAIARWKASGLRVMIYSSGSVPAQKLFFGHTNATPADLTDNISDWFDTVNAGLKNEQSSYEKIAAKYSSEAAPAEWLFLSDNLKEVEAARAAGMQSLPVIRPGNLPLPVENALSAEAIIDFSSINPTEA